eukprot:6186450-Pleurochrysis_carterae.AAC.3
MRAVPGEIVASAIMLWTLGSVPMSTSTSNLSVQAVCALARGGMTPKRTASCRWRKELQIAFVAFDDVERRVKAADVAVFIGAKERCLVELVGFAELEALEMLLLELWSSRCRKVGAATVATELEESNTANALTWMTWLNSRRANRLAALAFATCPQPRQLWHSISDALYRAKRFALSSVMPLLSALSLSLSSLDASRCIASTQWSPRERCGGAS